jgi:PAS domain S-box-containing protein
LPDADETDFQFLTENSVDIICRAGLDYALKYVSPSCFRILGWTQAEMMEAPPFGLMVPEDAPAVDAAIARTTASGSLFATVTVRMRRRTGRRYGWRRPPARCSTRLPER